MVIVGEHLKRWTIGLLSVTGVIGVLSLAAFFTVRAGAYDEVYRYFSLSSERGIAAYWNAGLLGIIAAAAVVSALLAPSRRARWGWLVIAAAMLFISLDEATALHERTYRLVRTNPFPTFNWIVLAIPLAILLVGILWWASRPLPLRVRRGLAAALAVFLLGALVLEAISGYFLGRDQEIVANWFATGEEMLEMAGCILAIHVIARSWLPLRLAPGVKGRRADHATPDPAAATG